MVNLGKKKNIILSIIALFLVVSLFGLVLADSIADDIHLTIQTTDSGGNIITGSYDFVFNISNSSTCSNFASVEYTNTTTLTTDDRGIISLYLHNVTINFAKQYYLCYYRNSTLKDTVRISKTPYSFRGIDVNTSSITADKNLNLLTYNITGSGKFYGTINASNITRENWIEASSESGLDVNSSTWWAGLTAWTSGWFTETANSLGFNETRLNNTINAFLGNGTFTGKIDWATAYNGTLARTTATNTFGAFNQTFDTNLLHIASNTNRVGIGTTTPKQTLNVKGTLNVTQNSTFDEGTLYVEENTNRVGINNTNPQHVLDVSGNLSVDNTLFVDTQNNRVQLCGKISCTGSGGTKSLLYVEGGRISPNTIDFILNVSSREIGTNQILVINRSGDVNFTGTRPVWITDRNKDNGELRIYNAAPALPYAALRVMSGATASYTSYGIGRVNVEGLWGIAGVADNYFTGTAAGDIVFIGNGTNKILFGSLSSTQPTLTVISNTTTADYRVGIGIPNPHNTLNVKGTFNVTSNSTFDEGTLYIESNTNRVSIGNRNPSKTLDVVGTGNFTSNLTVGGAINHSTYGVTENYKNGCKVTANATGWFLLC